VIERCAASPEFRNVLFDRMCELGLREQFPDRYATQLKFAEADMVTWLMYPTELDTVPDEIVAAQILRWRDPEHGQIDLYVFRFRTEPPHWSAEDGWMAGIAGPFPSGGLPVTRGMGGTFSKFTAWEKMSAIEHARDIAGVVSGELPDFEVLEPEEI
jgi:hypothetical protein